jgi:hypothetical protein
MALAARSDRAALLDRYRSGAQAVLDALARATDADLDRLPADGGWTPRMVVHHLADSEANAYIRLRRLVAEEAPLIVGYDEELWARRLHYERPIEPSLVVMAAVRTASLQLLESLAGAEWERSGRHSESGPYRLMDWLRTYADHPHDHADQIRRARGAA